MALTMLLQAPRAMIPRYRRLPASPSLLLKASDQGARVCLTVAELADVGRWVLTSDSQKTAVPPCWLDCMFSMVSSAIITLHFIIWAAMLAYVVPEPYASLRNG